MNTAEFLSQVCAEHALACPDVYDFGFPCHEWDTRTPCPVVRLARAVEAVLAVRDDRINDIPGSAYNQALKSVRAAINEHLEAE